MSRLAYEVTGPADGPVLLLGPSLGTTADGWAPQVPALSRRHRVVRFDLPGHGASPRPSRPLSVDDLAGMVLSVLGELGATRASYAGISLGGMIGMSLAAMAPDRLDRLALICTSAHMPPAEGWAERAALVRASGVEAVADTVVRRWFTDGFRSRSIPVVAEFRAMIAAVDAEGYATCCESIADMDLRPRLSQIAAPTLILAGRDDPATPPSHAQAIAEGIAGSRLHVLDNAAHLANIEQAAEVTAMMTGFLEEQ